MCLRFHADEQDGQKSVGDHQQQGEVMPESISLKAGADGNVLTRCF
jgi:hypothetical protein